MKDWREDGIVEVKSNFLAFSEIEFYSPCDNVNRQNVNGELFGSNC